MDKLTYSPVPNCRGGEGLISRGGGVWGKHLEIFQTKTEVRCVYFLDQIHFTKLENNFLHVILSVPLVLVITEVNQLLKVLLSGLLVLSVVNYLLREEGISVFYY